MILEILFTVVPLTAPRTYDPADYAPIDIAAEFGNPDFMATFERDMDRHFATWSEPVEIGTCGEAPRIGTPCKISDRELSAWSRQFSTLPAVEVDAAEQADEQPGYSLVFPNGSRCTPFRWHHGFVCN